MSLDTFVVHFNLALHKQKFRAERIWQIKANKRVILALSHSRGEYGDMQALLQAYARSIQRKTEFRALGPRQRRPGRIKSSPLGKLI